MPGKRDGCSFFKRLGVGIVQPSIPNLDVLGKSTKKVAMSKHTNNLTREQTLKLELHDLIERQSLLRMEIQRLEQLKTERVKELNAISGQRKPGPACSL